MAMSDEARNPDHTPMDVINRALSEVSNADVITIVMIDGDRLWQFSNARSAAELHGMLALAESMTD